MPNISHFLTLWAPDGTQFLDDLSDFTTLECVLAEGNIGTLTLTLPPGHNYTNFRRDARIAYYRAPTAALSAGQPRLQLVGNTTWLLAGRKRTLDLVNHRETTQLIATHPNHLLTRRIIAYDEKSAQADKSAAADNTIKAYVRENFVSATDTARNWASTLFTVDADQAAAPVVDKAASYRTILNTCQEIAAAASGGGTYTNFEIIGAERGAFRLRTYTAQKGVDRSSTSGRPLVISVAMGEFDTVELEENWIDTVSVAYVGGDGRADERLVSAVFDQALINETPYGWIEWFQSAGGTEDAAILADEGLRTIRERRPRVIFSGQVKDTEFATFMEEYNWGDRVVGEYARPDPQGAGFVDIQQFDCRVDPVRIRVERTEDPETGEQREVETLNIRLRSEA